MSLLIAKVLPLTESRCFPVCCCTETALSWEVICWDEFSLLGLHIFRAQKGVVIPFFSGCFMQSKEIALPLAFLVRIHSHDCCKGFSHCDLCSVNAIIKLEYHQDWKCRTSRKMETDCNFFACMHTCAVSSVLGTNLEKKNEEAKYLFQVKPLSLCTMEDTQKRNKDYVFLSLETLGSFCLCF